MKFDNIYVFTPKSNGGVKEVCDSLASGFAENGILVTQVNSFKRAILISLRNLFDTKSTLFITNLSFGIFGIFSRKSIFIIHGYPFLRTEGYIKYKIKNIFHKIFSLVNNKVVAVSFLTRYICENHLGIKIDSVIQNPIPLGFVSPFVEKRKDSLVYVGRIVESKNIEKILISLNILREKHAERAFVFHIIGTGPLLKDLKEKYNHIHNIFHGYISVDLKYKIMKSAVAFISLCEGEPYGLTALEAKHLNLVSVLPTYGGHQEFLSKNSLYNVNDIYDCDEISSAIFQALNDTRETSNSSDKLLESDYPKKIASRYLNLFK